MKIALVDVDGKHYPNLALMRLSAWHKAQGEQVEWYSPLFSKPDRIYASKVFSFSADFKDYAACDPEPVRGGTGAAVEVIRDAGYRGEFFCYMLVQDDLEDAEYRLRELVKLKVTPFAQPYRDFSGKAETTKSQRDFARFANVKGGKLCLKMSFKEYYH